MPKPEGNGKGLWISPDIKANSDLTWNEKALFAYMRFRADKGGEFWEFNHNIAQALGISESTVKRGLTRLAKLGLVEGKKGDGATMRVRMAADWYAEKGLPDGSNMRGAGQVEPCGAAQAEPLHGSERTPPLLKLTPCHRSK
jgi:DNA-binding transcriptional MocR family regulator